MHRMAEHPFNGISETYVRDVAIAYRIYPKVAKVALPFGDDKLRLSEICLKSLKGSLEGLRIKIWVVLDGCPSTYAQLFRKYFDADDLILTELNGVGNELTFRKQLDLLLAQRDAELVYFAEDDYFYLPGQFAILVRFLREHQDVDFVSPYDHLDCYSLDLHRFPKWLKAYGGRHWRTAASTCLTFLTRRETLRKTQAVFRNYRRTSLDCSLWLSLTKIRVFNPLFFIRCLFREPNFAKIICKSWIYCWRQILFGRRRKLWVPVPGVATHLDAHALSPNTDWDELLRQAMATPVSAAD